MNTIFFSPGFGRKCHCANRQMSVNAFFHDSMNNIFSDENLWHFSSLWSKYLLE